MAEVPARRSHAHLLRGRNRARRLYHDARSTRRHEAIGRCTVHATYFPGQGDRPGYLLWVVRDTVVAQPFDSASTEFMGSPRVRARNRGRLLVLRDRPFERVGVQRRHAALHRRIAVSVGMVQTRRHRAWNRGATEQYIGLRLSPTAARPGHHQGRGEKETSGVSISLVGLVAG